jgi:hypothetical protein
MMRTLTACIAGGTAGIFTGVSGQAAHDGEVASGTDAHLLAANAIAVFTEGG